MRVCTLDVIILPFKLIYTSFIPHLYFKIISVIISLFQRAMACHESQFVWFRKVYITSPSKSSDFKIFRYLEHLELSHNILELPFIILELSPYLVVSEGYGMP